MSTTDRGGERGALTGADMLDCAICGEVASQALNVATDKYGRIDARAYYCHCFNGDCGAEGPNRSTSDESIQAWNEQQRALLAALSGGRT